MESKPLIAIKCRMCGKASPTNGVICLGCGTPVENARDNRRPKSPATAKACPACDASGPHTLLEPGRYSCKKCFTVFEPDDGVALDHDPVRNFERTLQEQQRERQRKNRRRGWR